MPCTLEEIMLDLHPDRARCDRSAASFLATTDADGSRAARAGGR